MQAFKSRLMTVLDRAVIGSLVLLTLMLLGAQIAKATEIIPSVGLTKPVDGNEDAKLYGSLGVRGNLLPILKTEVGVAYRQEDRLDDQLHVRMWPVTASLWLTPIPALYAGGGVGWYNITFDYDQDRIAVPVSDETRQEFGVHLGGGVMVPLGSAAALDLNGRYVMMRDQQSRLIPEQFDPDFWQSSLGIAFKF